MQGRIDERDQRLQEQLVEKDREIAELRARLARSQGATAKGGAVKPENVVWIFGSGRTGSTWLSVMMEELPNTARWNEPLVGYLFGHTYHERAEHRVEDKNFVLGNDYKETWLDSARDLVLDGAAARFPEVAGSGYVVIKEPHGSRGATFLMEALPESRMILLVRDPRDVVSSTLNATWIPKRRTGRRERRAKRVAERPDTFVRTRAGGYLQDITHAKQAYDAHGGRKVLVRYEELRADAVETMKHICSTLEITVPERKLVKGVQKYAWENLPNAGGRNKGRRKATPGGWREDLTPEQVEIVEEITAPLLDEFYPDWKSGALA